MSHCRSLYKLIVRRMSSTVETVNTKVVQPKWNVPEPQQTKPVLKLYNSLTRTKVPFVPLSGTKTVSWYSCGPTVYDASHMGHARNYVSIDINRRIMSEYFGYDIKFVQNVTDIDDKIIIRARQNYLFDNFIKDVTTIDEAIVSKVNDAIVAYIVKNLNDQLSRVDEFDKWVAGLNIETEKVNNPKFPMHITAVTNAITALKEKSNDVTQFFTLSKDVLVPILDKELGATVNDPEVFRKLPAYWENDFNNDMAQLNVTPPSVTTRVSEYVPEIVEFVQRIIDNGYGYATDDGSVYFDTVAFDSSDKHSYAKCQPWNKGQLDLIEDGEGSLSTNTKEKKSKNDFALWKASKPGEPEWESPWGKGRPGWHIECSVMASDILGSEIDIHSGGIDLAFPHHDNELAQSEACFDNEQWINYFLHTGHLHIEGQKMSKSLKNFITIKEALNNYSARQLRLVFASAQWNNQLDFKESLVNEVKSLETSFNNFFQNVRALQSDNSHRQEGMSHNISKKFTSLETKLLNDLQSTQEKVDIAFCDNLATAQAIKALSDMVTITNSYISTVGNDLKIEPVLDVCKYITKILNIIGFQGRPDSLGWVNASASSKSTGSVEEVAMPYVKVLSTFRDNVRSLAIEKAPLSEFLKLTDFVRDNDLLKLNVSLDDRNGQSALVKFLTDEEKLEIVKFNEEKEAREEAKRLKKLQQQKLKEQKEQERKEKAKVSPLEMFKNNELYSAWDENGLPTKDKDGNDVTKSMTKKLKKQWDQQKKLHEEFFGSVN
ncbi:similar to Saccharomyces cerevisiae YNL247W Cysteinyl-tRNA synthetase [Maudiozyma barnettii]|uniref:cysteine--tRNA ligase n=1 Tax=Maudiozyma barnettii TaxID=61262 RepID=A0A8H2ZGS6_9SACH|nr:cysteine--tRNA ligase [Kazachstania barnettii]CAB4253832.1 similar to Saccharomyces cerevisiae YNL247W Cysteinyl-tRNA synthetase [Kazachstania barnettii]CAD1781581.1 similar to Saccharomyces cerevisiae YNL247W Cysteinyl-tRNA synthetase [Kazachstania barnettii]